MDSSRPKTAGRVTKSTAASSRWNVQNLRDEKRRSRRPNCFAGNPQRVIRPSSAAARITAHANGLRAGGSQRARYSRPKLEAGTCSNPLYSRVTRPVRICPILLVATAVDSRKIAPDLGFCGFTRPAVGRVAGVGAKVFIAIVAPNLPGRPKYHRGDSLKRIHRRLSRRFGRLWCEIVISCPPGAALYIIGPERLHYARLDRWRFQLAPHFLPTRLL